MSSLRVLVTGASPDRTNRNTALRSYVFEGFQQLLGTEHVTHTPLEQAAKSISGGRPDVVICFGSCMPDDADYSDLRHLCDITGAVLAFWLHDDPYEFDFSYKVCSVADFIFSNDKWSALHYDHPRTFHLPLAASKSAHWRPLTNARDIDIFFCGVAFPNRIRLLNDFKRVLANYRTSILGDQWPEDQLPFAKNRRLSNLELSNHYAQSLLTLNMGRDFHYANDRYKLEPSTPGPRTFEAAMAGTTQLYFVESLEIEDYYQPDKEIVLFDSMAELEKVVQELTNDRQKAAEISAAAQTRTLSDHTYCNRAHFIINVIQQEKYGQAGESPWNSEMFAICTPRGA